MKLSLENHSGKVVIAGTKEVVEAEFRVGGGQYSESDLSEVEVNLVLTNMLMSLADTIRPKGNFPFPLEIAGRDVDIYWSLQLPDGKNAVYEHTV